MTCQTRLRTTHTLRRPRRQMTRTIMTSVPVSETPLSDIRDASHIKSKSSVDTADGVRQRLKFDGEASGMTPDPKRSKETVKQGEICESNALPCWSRLRGRKCDSCPILEMAAPLLSPWKTWLKTTGQTSMARVRCLRDSISRWNQTWKLSTLKLHWIVCWKMNGVVRDIPGAEVCWHETAEHQVGENLQETQQ